MGRRAHLSAIDTAASNPANTLDIDVLRQIFLFDAPEPARAEHRASATVLKQKCSPLAPGGVTAAKPGPAEM
jgi:hypothetical protein